MIKRKYGYFVKLNKDLIIYMFNGKIVKRIFIAESNNQDGEYDIIKINIDDSNKDISENLKHKEVVLGTFYSQKQARKALKKISHEKIFWPQWILFGLTGVIFFIIGMQFPTKVINITPPSQQINPMLMASMMNGGNDLPTIPMTTPKISNRLPIVNQSIQDTNQQIDNDKIKAFELAMKNGDKISPELIHSLPIGMQKLAEISIAIKERKPITPNMLKDLPDEIQEKIKTVAINANIFVESDNDKAELSKESGGMYLGSHKVTNSTIEKEDNPLDVLSVKPTNTNKNEPIDSLAVEKNNKINEIININHNEKNQKGLKELEDKKKLFDGALDSKIGLKPVTSDYKTYDDFKKDYPEKINNSDKK